MIWLLLGSATFAGAGLVLASLQLRAVRAEPSRSLGSLVSRLQRAREGDRVIVATLETEGRSWEGRLARALAAAEDEASRVDVASEAVSDLALRYGSRSKWGWSALRIQVFSGVLMASLAVAGQDRLGAVLSLLVAALGATGVHMISRAALDLEKKQRFNADKLIHLLLPTVHQEGEPKFSAQRPSTERKREARRRR